MFDVEIILKTTVLLLLLKVVPEMLPSMATRKPPWSVRIVGDLELAFGTSIALPSLLFLFPIPVASWTHKPALLLMALVPIGIAWGILAVELLRGRPWARQVCLILCVMRVFVLLGIPFSLANECLFMLRVFTLAGIPLSFVSLYVLCVNGKAKSFFAEGQAPQAEAASNG